VILPEKGGIYDYEYEHCTGGAGYVAGRVIVELPVV
jgi:hypothetical protein